MHETESPAPKTTAQLLSENRDLAGLCKRLAQRLHPEDPLRVTATDYLKEQGFFNPLRTLGVSELGHQVIRTAGTDEQGKPTP